MTNDGGTVSRRKSKEMAETEPKHVPRANWTGGPHGLGDPNDRSLRKVESEVLIPKKIRERSRAEKCVEEVRAFTECCSDSGLSMVVKCRKENTILKACLAKWFLNEEFAAECKEEYLAERSEYRRTGIGKKSKDSPLGSKRVQSSM